MRNAQRRKARHAREPAKKTMPRARPSSSRVLLAAVAAAAALFAAPTLARAQLHSRAAPASPPPSASGLACPLKAANVSLARPGTVAHAFSPAQAAEFVANQAKPSVLSHYTTTFDCVDSR